MMTRDDAMTVAATFREIPGFEVNIYEHGFETGNWLVELWSVNASRGTRDLTCVDHVPAGAKEVRQIARQAKGLASQRAAEVRRHLAAERGIDLE